MINLPILTIRQPWAWAIIHAGKDIENRDWKPKYRGRFWVLASKQLFKKEIGSFVDTMNNSYPSIEIPGGSNDPRSIDYEGLNRGGIIGSVELVDVVEQSDSPWFFGKYGYVLRDPRPCEFIPMKGQLGFFRRDEMEGK